MLSNLTADTRFGYYQVNDRRFRLKSDALIYASTTKSAVTWYFGEDVFSAINWSTPIQSSLRELYKLRAQQLRDKYDFVSLFYSGGVDSTNVLHSFIDNDIFLDEIVIYRPKVIENRLNSEDKTPYNLFSETKYAAIPHLKKCTLDSRTTVRIIHIDEAIFKFFDDPILPMQFTNFSDYSSHGIGKVAMAMTDPVWNKLYAAGKRVGHIQGADKPIIQIDGDSYFFQFWDSAAAFIWEPSFHTDLTEMVQSHQFHEMFYWSPDFPLIPIKQCQILKKLCQINPYFFKLFTTAINVAQDALSARLPYIYPASVISIRDEFTTTSPGTGIYAPQTAWFYEKMPGEIMGKFADITRGIRAKTDNRFFRPGGTEPSGTVESPNNLGLAGIKFSMRSIPSKRYYI